MASALNRADLQRLREIYHHAYWAAWEGKSKDAIERDSLMHQHAHAEALKAVVETVLNESHRER